MFKPRTIAQFKVVQFMKQNNFVMDQFVIFPESRTSLRIEDRTGEILILGLRGDTVQEVPAAPVPSNEKSQAFIRSYLLDPHCPPLRDLDDIVEWWHKEDRPISLQQALGLHDDLYRYYQTHEIMDTSQVRAIASQGYVSEEDYLGIRLWYRNGNSSGNWLGSEGVDGTGNRYGIKFHHLTPEEEHLIFYVMDDYYRWMNESASAPSLDSP